MIKHITLNVGSKIIIFLSEECGDQYHVINAQFENNMYIFDHFQNFTNEKFLEYLIINNLCELIQLKTEHELDINITYYKLTQTALLEAL